MSIRMYAGKAAVAVVTATTLVAGGGALSSAHADPAPPVPVGARLTATAVPTAFRMATMSLGRVDDPNLGQYRPVAMTQLLLRRWTPTLTVDGSFGYRTKGAVETFQRAEGLAVTGSLTRADFYRLFVRQTVQYGSKGDAVRAAQIWLSRNPASGVAVDGSFGPATRRAVFAEQRSHGACHGTGVDGIVGPMTRAMSYEYEHDSGPC
ncbi:peptidoglycan-binding domain-containing protein [Luteipulveratus flavus]|uniref:Peptidoglycan-binding protein n=1 Tax=Luteipulveratus flavus TaxID=3031728 RepID=A0ABT6C2S4_9MICO|nr:peptidoglycan-binding protein [Luteipulveratus sp. YIM 133296]MDF8263253.1 peptidoglycan-binding protein [Luteipulveratus sp. YIM 133296]